MVGCRVRRAYNHQGAHTLRNLAWESYKILFIFLFSGQTAVHHNKQDRGFFQALVMAHLVATNGLQAFFGMKIGLGSGNVVGQA